MTHRARVKVVLRALVLALPVALVLSACGSGSPSSGTVTHTVVSKIVQSGPGLTEPTTGSGARIKGGTVTFAEAPGAPPNYIFPMYSSEYCNNSDIYGVISMLYRPLYWFGNNYSPTVDLNDSVGQKPIYSNAGKTVTIHLNHYMWSDGEPVQARDLVFWMNVMKANPAGEWCGYAPGKFPDNVTSYRAINPSTFQLTFNKRYNQTWLLYEELTQLTPIPMAWDKTSASQPSPSANAQNLPDTTKAGAAAVYRFLNSQSTAILSWGSSPLWKIVDGPWKIQSTTSNGGITYVPNSHYTGPVKPSLSKFIEVPFTSEAALLDELKSEGPDGLTVAYVPSQYEPLTKQIAAEGYRVNRGSSYGISFFPLNFNAPRVGKIFRQLYFRQALQHLVDQQGWIRHFLFGAAVPTYGPGPLTPPNSVVSSSVESDIYPFSVPAAARLLTENGWHVVPGGTTTCAKSGTGPGECGAGISRGEDIAFNIDYASDFVSLQEEMEDLQSQASKVGIKINLTTHPTDDVASAETHCSAGQPNCRWNAEDISGYSWTYSYYPSGEELFDSTANTNYSNYSSAKMDQLINTTLTASDGDEQSAMNAYFLYAEKQLPVVWVPQPLGAFDQANAGNLISDKLGGFTVNANGFFAPEQWYLTK